MILVGNDINAPIAAGSYICTESGNLACNEGGRVTPYTHDSMAHRYPNEQYKLQLSLRIHIPFLSGENKTDAVKLKRSYYNRDNDLTVGVSCHSVFRPVRRVRLNPDLTVWVFGFLFTPALKRCDSPDNKVHGANTGPHVCPMNFAIWEKIPSGRPQAIKSLWVYTNIIIENIKLPPIPLLCRPILLRSHTLRRKQITAQS